MGIGFVIVGFVLIVTGTQNTYAQLGAQLDKDFTGQGNFTYWIVALGAVGALGYIPALKVFSTYFMALILLALFLSKGQGFFSQFQSALASGPVAPSGNAAASQASAGTSNTLNPFGSLPFGDPGQTLMQYLFGAPHLEYGTQNPSPSTGETYGISP